MPAGPVNDIEGGFDLAESLGLDVVDEIDGIRIPASPIQLSEDPPEIRLAPPELDGQGEMLRAWLAGPDLS